MAAWVGEKRKNDEKAKRRGIPWWLLLLTGFALGIIFTLSASMGRGGTTTVYSSQMNPDALLLEATQLVIQATLAAEAPLLMQPPLDPLFIQATQLSGEATLHAQAAQNHWIAENDSFAATATAIILQATQAANP